MSHTAQCRVLPLAGSWIGTEEAKSSLGMQMIQIKQNLVVYTSFSELVSQNRNSSTKLRYIQRQNPESTPTRRGT